jgi:hypothetical protein
LVLLSVLLFTNPIIILFSFFSLYRTIWAFRKLGTSRIKHLESFLLDYWYEIYLRRQHSSHYQGSLITLLSWMFHDFIFTYFLPRLRIRLVRLG